MHFKEWLYRSGRSIKTVNHYAGAVYGILTQISLTEKSEEAPDFIINRAHYACRA